MYYDSFKDYLIDNRNGIKADINDMMNVDELRAEVLRAYDFVAEKAIGSVKGYNLLKKVIIDKYGDDEFKNLENETLKYFNEYEEARAEYVRDIMDDKKRSVILLCSDGMNSNDLRASGLYSSAEWFREQQSKKTEYLSSVGVRGDCL